MWTLEKDDILHQSWGLLSTVPIIIFERRCRGRWDWSWLDDSKLWSIMWKGQFTLWWASDGPSFIDNGEISLGKTRGEGLNLESCQHLCHSWDKTLKDYDFHNLSPSVFVLKPWLPIKPANNVIIRRCSLPLPYPEYQVILLTNHGENIKSGRCHLPHVKEIPTGESQYPYLRVYLTHTSKREARRKSDCMTQLRHTTQDLTETPGVLSLSGH